MHASEPQFDDGDETATVVPGDGPSRSAQGGAPWLEPTCHCNDTLAAVGGSAEETAAALPREPGIATEINGAGMTRCTEGGVTCEVE